jgi:hypothetical protein
MDVLEKYENLKDRISESFVILFPNGEFFEDFGAIKLAHNSTFNNVFLTFKTNIKAVISVASIPMEMATTWTRLETYNGFFRQEMILSTPIRFDDKEYEGLSEKEIEASKNTEHLQQVERAQKQAAIRFKNEVSCKEGARRFYINTFNFIDDCTRKDNQFTNSAKDLLNQSSLLTWSAFEILFRDFFIAYYNSNFNRIESILNDNSLKQRFNLKNIPFEKLFEYNFDLSHNMGDVLIENYDFSNLEVIRTVAAVMFDDDIELIKMFKNDALWELYQRRNLIVHRGGISDRRYLEKSRDNLDLGEKLYISPSELLGYLKLIKEIGLKMFSRLTTDSF